MSTTIAAQPDAAVAAVAAGAAVAAVAAVAAIAWTAPTGTLLVGDAKRLITTTYPKLYSRFNYAFHGHEDSEPLSEAIDVITSDIAAWLKSMPDNFKTSNHALSRPKYGLIFVLKHDAIRASIGDAHCTAAIAAIERAWDECKKDIVVVSVKEDATPAAAAAAAGSLDDDLHARIYELTARNELLTVTLVAMLGKHYDGVVAALVESLLIKA
jgi:hypothetical protein